MGEIVSEEQKRLPMGQPFKDCSAGQPRIRGFL